MIGVRTYIYIYHSLNLIAIKCKASSGLEHCNFACNSACKVDSPIFIQSENARLRHTTQATTVQCSPGDFCRRHRGGISN